MQLPEQQLITPEPSRSNPETRTRTSTPRPEEADSASAYFVPGRATTPRELRTAIIFNTLGRANSQPGSPLNITALPLGDTISEDNNTGSNITEAEIHQPAPILPPTSASIINLNDDDSIMSEHAAGHDAPSPAPTEPEPAQTISSNNGFRPTTLLKDNALPAFNGDKEKARWFIVTAGTLFRSIELQNVPLTDNMKIAFVLNRMTDGDAMLWSLAKQEEAERKVPYSLGTWKSFKKEFERAFISIADTEDARLQLSRFKQGNLSIEQYTTQFKALLSRCDFTSQDEHKHLYKRGLNANILEKLIVIPSNLDDFYDMATVIGRTIEEIKDELKGRNNYKGRSNQGSGKTYNQSGQRPRIEKLTPEERARCIKDGLCFRCRQAGHSSQNCPNSNKPQSTTPQNKNIRATDTATIAENKATSVEPKETTTKSNDPVANIRRLFSQLNDEQKSQYFAEVEKEGF